MKQSHFWACLPLLLFLVLNVSSMRCKSLTSDEGIRLSTGYLLWHTHEHRLERGHLPMVKLIGSLPFVLRYPDALEKNPAWRTQDISALTQNLLFDQGIDLDGILFWGRILMLSFGVGTAIIVYFFSRALWGFWGGMLSLTLLCLCPNFIAHSQLITDDVAVSFGVVGVSYTAWLYMQQATWRRLFGFAVFTAIALAAKFSALLLLPFIFFCLVRAQLRSGNRSFKSGFHHALAFLALVLVVISWSYRTLFNPLPFLTDAFYIFKPSDRPFLSRNEIYAYFMNGKFSTEGFFLYYPFALLLKLPIPSQLFTILGVTRCRRLGRNACLAIALPFALILGAAIMLRVNVGIRYVLPCLPLLFILAGAAVQINRKALALHVALLAWLAFETLHVHPDYLAYFNQLAGGSKGGLRYLDDSNIDWGQDLKGLPKALGELGIKTVKLDYPWAENPHYRQIDYTPVSYLDLFFPQGDFAISANRLRRNTLYPPFDGLNYDWLERYQPAVILGHSLYVFRFSIGDKSEFKDGVNTLEKSAWLEHGFSRLGAIVQHYPECLPCHKLLGDAHFEWGHPEDALAIYERILDKHPGNQEVRQKVQTLRQKLNHPE